MRTKCQIAKIYILRNILVCIDVALERNLPPMMKKCSHASVGTSSSGVKTKTKKPSWLIKKPEFFGPLLLFGYLETFRSNFSCVSWK